MRPGDIEKLLGGYATGTLTSDERDALFLAALTNQELFNALADEQALKELLDDPVARRQLLAALRPEKLPLLERLRMWVRRPAAWAAAGSVAAAVLLAIIVSQTGRPPAEPEFTLEARRRTPPAPEIVSPAPPSIPASSRKAANEPPASAPKKNQETMAKKDSLKPVAELERPVVTAESKLPVAAAPAPPAEQAEVAGGVAGFREGAERKSNLASRAVEQQQAVKALAVRNTVKGERSEADAAALQDQRATVDYRILRMDSDGNYSEVHPKTTFRAGDLIRLVVKPLEAGYLSVTLQKTRNMRERLFNGRVVRGATYDIPETAGIKLPETAGEQKLILVVSPVPGTGAAILSARKTAEPIVIEIPLKYR